MISRKEQKLKERKKKKEELKQFETFISKGNKKLTTTEKNQLVLNEMSRIKNNDFREVVETTEDSTYYKGKYKYRKVIQKILVDFGSGPKEIQQTVETDF